MISPRTLEHKDLSEAQIKFNFAELMRVLVAVLVETEHENFVFLSGMPR